MYKQWGNGDMESEQWRHGIITAIFKKVVQIYIYNLWTENLDQGGKVDIVYIHFAKAFNKVPRRRLIGKLEPNGVVGRVGAWIQAFLSGRVQKVTVNGHSSSWTNVTSGIPQGSVLGPLLLFFYINDMPNYVSSEMSLFADDTKLYRDVSTYRDYAQLQDDLEQLPFDKVPRRRLIGKLEPNGVVGRVGAWIQAFLFGRVQKVTGNGHSSSWTNVTSGIPQGSVLGPLLLFFDINDMPNYVSSEMSLFADDTKFYRDVSTYRDYAQLQDDLEQLREWSLT
ncbi:uncharacterized protein LOC117112701 [Anneissia japonica]|uniref:uncharacterized protein LOC117112701 n=1 Tax=Anneissia japonica TaxID=1529436 RepID=UPI0014257327|nr:uncharacterized protein LOC117112701 [Anneissia japonica]